MQTKTRDLRKQVTSDSSVQPLLTSTSSKWENPSVTLIHLFIPLSFPFLFFSLLSHSLRSINNDHSLLLGVRRKGSTFHRLSQCYCQAVNSLNVDTMSCHLVLSWSFSSRCQWFSSVVELDSFLFFPFTLDVHGQNECTFTSPQKSLKEPIRSLRWIFIANILHRHQVKPSNVLISPPKKVKNYR